MDGRPQADPSGVPPQVPGYDVLHRLGTGGSGRVWAVRRADGVRLAAKFVDLDDGEVLQHEASLLRALRHEHVVRLYDLVVAQDGGPVLVMQLAEGGSLAESLRTRDHLTPGELVTVLCPVARALHDLHSMGLVHGDLSPGNILFTEEGKPLIADLGFSHVAGHDGVPLWVTESWAAPETLAGDRVTPASDAYSLGAIAWTALVGAAPEPAALRPDLADLAPHLSAELRDLVLSCLSHTPSARPTPEDFAVALWATAPAAPAPVQGSAGRRTAPEGAADDPGVQLTRRMREVAGREDGSREGRSRTGVAARGSEPGGARPWEGIGRHSARDAPSAWWRRPVVARTAGAAAFVGLVAGGLMLVGDGSSAGAGRAAPTTASGRSSSAPPTGATPVPLAARSSQSAPGATPSTASHFPALSPQQRLARYPVGVLQLLVDARAHAWVTGKPADLRSAVRAGSAAYRSDTTDLGIARADGMCYSRLAFRVRSARTTSTRGGVTHLLAVIDRSAYGVSGPDGTRTVAASAGERTDVSLAWTPDGWRITAWTAA
ncbi:serine/threonine-protein kinase [Allobranchiibius sp. CTAmp26]|uniref:serine/threonine-protein kinase n=1 Tax=Allobranchiibius sp. CTAmp26 TaxID=2815214 RepID=UPI001AA12785|nr:serine/threonine-protein kinase [Allobranchiibius sp. CTAmp26]MBO1755290.1 protein kinase [Allobranchiibius sp. CTAmp26]